MSTHEQVLNAMFTALEAGVNTSTTTAYRNVEVPFDGDLTENSDGIASMTDGQPEEDTGIGNGPPYYWTRDVTVGISVMHATPAIRSAQFEALEKSVYDALNLDDTLGGLIKGMTVEAADREPDAIAGAESEMAGRMIVTIEYETSEKF